MDGWRWGMESRRGRKLTAVEKRWRDEGWRRREKGGWNWSGWVFFLLRLLLFLNSGLSPPTLLHSSPPSLPRLCVTRLSSLLSSLLLLPSPSLLSSSVRHVPPLRGRSTLWANLLLANWLAALLACLHCHKNSHKCKPQHANMLTGTCCYLAVDVYQLHCVSMLTPLFPLIYTSLFLLWAKILLANSPANP